MIAVRSVFSLAGLIAYAAGLFLARGAWRRRSWGLPYAGESVLATAALLSAAFFVYVAVVS